MMILQRLISFICLGLLIGLGPSAAWAGTTYKFVKSGKTVLVYTQQFGGGRPSGVKPPRLLIKQPQNGKLEAKKRVVKQNGMKAVLYEFFYTSKKGFKGTDRAMAGLSLQMKTRNGKIWIDYDETLVIRVR